MKTDLDLLVKVKQLYDKSQLDTKFANVEQQITANDSEISTINESLSNISNTVTTNTENIDVNTSSITALSESVNTNALNIKDLFNINGLYDTEDGDITPVMTSNTTPSPYSFTMATGGFNGGDVNNLYKLLGSTGTFSVQIKSNSDAILDLGETKTVVKFKINVAYVRSGADNKITVYGSNDGTTYTQLGIGTGITFPASWIEFDNTSELKDVRYLKFNFYGWNGSWDLTVFNIVVMGKVKLDLPDKIMLVDSEDKLVNEDTTTQKEVLAFIKDSGIYYYNQRTNNKIQILNIPDISIINWDWLADKPFETLSLDDFEISDDGSVSIKQSIIDRISNNENSIKNAVKFIHNNPGQPTEIQDFTPTFTSLTTPEPYQLIPINMTLRSGDAGPVWAPFLREIDSTVYTRFTTPTGLSFTVDLGQQEYFYGIDIKIGHETNYGNFDIYGSNDNSQFTNIFSQSQVYIKGNPYDAEKKRFVCTTIGKYRYIKFKFSDNTNNGNWKFASIKLLRLASLPEYTDGAKFIIADSVNELQESVNYSNSKILAFVKDDGIYSYDGVLGTRIKVLNIPDLSSVISNWTDIQDKPFKTIDTESLDVSTEGVLSINQTILDNINVSPVWEEIQTKPFETIGDTLSVAVGGVLNVNENIINGIESDISNIEKYLIYIDDPQW